MDEDYVYLSPNTVLEPLIDRWYAWSHLVSPATAAMNILNRHLKIINSFIQAPDVHVAAVQNPKLLGGPFMDTPKARVGEVKDLKARTLDERSDLIELAKAIKELDQLLKQQAKGYSLEPLYEQIPPLLKGYVELLYDLNGNPSYRFFESLLYRSKFYNPASQSIALWLTHNDSRPFVLSTPRLDEPAVLHLPIPFNHPAIDLLASMKRQPRRLSDVKRLLDVPAFDEALLASFFTTDTPPTYSKYEGDFIRMRYFGHACVLIETNDVSVLVDPVVSYYGYPSDVSRFSDANLPDVIDYVLITHNHQDHVLLETLLSLRSRIRHIVIPKSVGGSLQDPNLKLMFQHIGFDQVVEIDEMESLRFSNCTITGIPFIGEHCDLNIRTKMCYLVKIADFSILFVADSCIVEPQLYDHIHALTGDVDVLLLGMECDGAPLTWLYGPLLTEDLARDKDQSRRLAGSNYERGLSLVDRFNPKEVYVYAMGMEPWLEFISSIRYTDESNPIVASNALINACRERGLLAERLFGEKELLYVPVEG
ncbi:MBL fold metallo-hydrolase [Fibrella sp. HMF5036]|uniref:MBL fold metallo-hydrolase n=2 Tax=Fibrella aquatilis TaxID=2817059 RepID=A0A939K1J4_9BACT|nr:MBL fold metallo-hydrolase [Fibrella aquatilis]